MGWEQILIIVLTIFGTVLTIVGTLGGFMFWMFGKLDSDVKELHQDIRMLDGDIKQAHRRMDQLYQIIIDVVKGK